MDTYILDDLDSFDPDSIYGDTGLDDINDDVDDINDDVDDINDDVDENVYIDEASIISEEELSDLVKDENVSSFSFNDDINHSLTNSEEHHHDHSQISFKGLGRCRVCSCGGWAGYGDTCNNCGHFFNKHI